MDIFEFDNGEDLILSDSRFDLVFLGYRLPHANGMDTARALRLKSPLCGIIFITDYPDFIYESFEVQPYSFFKKPIDTKKIVTALDSFIKSQNRIFPLNILHEGEQKIIIADDIIYLEGDGKHCIIRTKDQTYHSSKTLSEVFRRLPEDYFYRIHKSYVANMNYIRTVNNKTVTFINGEKALISRACLPGFKNTYMQFCQRFSIDIF